MPQLWRRQHFSAYSSRLRLQVLQKVNKDTGAQQQYQCGGKWFYLLSAWRVTHDRRVTVTKQSEARQGNATRFDVSLISSRKYWLHADLHGSNLVQRVKGQMAHGWRNKGEIFPFVVLEIFCSPCWHLFSEYYRPHYSKCGPLTRNLSIT